MGWREAVRLSDRAFAEVSLQAIYGFRQGNLATGGSPEELVARARRRVRQSKAMVAGLLGLLTLGGSVALREAGFLTAHFLPYSLAPGVFDAGVLAALLGLDVAFLWWLGLQVLPVFLASAVLPIMEALPIEEGSLRRAAALTYLRLFDYPLAVVVLLTPSLVGLALGPAAGAATVPGVVVACVFALAASLLTSRFLLRRLYAPSGRGGSLLRWASLTLWVAPVFGLFGLVTLAPAFFRALAGLAAGAPSADFAGLFLAFPFSLAALPPIAAGGPGALPLGEAGSLGVAAAAIAYGGLALGLLAGLGDAVRRIGATPYGFGTARAPRRFGLQVVAPAYAVLVKDLRIASRAPGYAFLILLPIVDSLALGLVSFLPGASAGSADALALAAVTSSALLATFFAPAFFAIEVLAYSYGRTLPLSDRSLLLGKVALVVAIYLASAAAVLGVVDVRLQQPLVFLAFVLAELPAVAAAALLELGLVLRRAASRGLPVVNLYAGAWIAVAIAIPGLLVAVAPLVAFALLRPASTNLALGGLGLVAGAALVGTLPVLFRGERT